jgi:hypothetical protein
MSDAVQGLSKRKNPIPDALRAIMRANSLALETLTKKASYSGSPKRPETTCSERTDAKASAR